MAQQEIKLSGIVRNLPDNTVPDGMMQELINLRPRDGALRPVGIKNRIASVPTDVRFIHSINDSIKVYIGTAGGYINYWVYQDGVLLSGPTATTVLGDAYSSFASLHNTLMIGNNTAELLTMLVFNSDTNTYAEFTDFLPDMPPISFARLAVAGDDDGPDTFDVSLEGDITEAELSQYVKMQNKKADDGYLNGAVLLRCAWEMVDGTIVKHTIPVKLYTSQITTTGSIVGGYWQISTAFTAYKVQFKLNCTTALLSGIQAKYKNVIRGLKIYVTLPRSPQVEDRKIFNARAGRYFDVSYLYEYVPNIDTMEYFLLKDYKLESLSADTLITISPESVIDLATREQMTVNNLSHHKLFAKRLFAYNQRIFLGDVKVTLYQGPSVKGLILPAPGNASGTAYDVGIEYDISVSSQETKTVFTGWETFDYTVDGEIKFYLMYAGGRRLDKDTGYFGYPDARATMARVFIRQGATIKRVLLRALDSYQELNFSITKGLLIQGPLSGYPDGTLVSGKNYYYDNDRIQATELSNPFYFPPINSYRLQGKILGMSTNAVALSQGQFGQFPIFCFTSEGIWTMNIGSGETLINTITPLTRDVCNNPASITPIDGGTVFSTSKGLFIIVGPKPLEISEAAEGKYQGALSGGLNFEAVINNPNLYQVKNYLCSALFLTYISGAKIAWDQTHEEIIVSNEGYSYSWIFSLKYKIWFKISQVFSSFISDYPVTYGYSTISGTYYQHNMNQESFNSLIPVHLETRPLKLSKGAFKKIARILLEGWIGEGATRPFSVNLFGSPDNVRWFLLNASKTFNPGQSMVIGKASFSCRRYIIVAGGQVDENTYLSSISTDFEERYNDKLR